MVHLFYPFFQNDDHNGDSIGLYRFPSYYLLENEIFDKYVKHHLEWLKRVIGEGSLTDEDIRWVRQM